jgi:ADP-ribose pyrophosphatase YjhB (NUDIX family)
MATTARTVKKVRALIIGKNGETYGITGRAAHVLQLVGGGMKPGETPCKAIRREAREESGFKVKIVRRLAARRYVREDGTVEKTILFVVRITGGSRKTRMTGRERKRGLRITTFKSPRALAKALKRTARRYQRTAARRDLDLTRLALAALPR